VRRAGASAAFAAVFAAAICISHAGCTVLAEIADEKVNSVGDGPPPSPLPEDYAFHNTLLIGDLHADTLLWNRNFISMDPRGHLDLPRLVKGNVTIQAFSVATKTPLQQSMGKGVHCVPSDGANFTTLLSMLQLRPIGTWFDLEARALYQSKIMHEWVAKSRSAGPEVRILKSAEDLDYVISQQRTGRRVIGALLGLEGVHWLGSMPEETISAGIRRLHDAGFRMLALTHRFDNALAGASEGCSGGPLTAIGRRVLQEAVNRGFLIDLAHLSSSALAESTQFGTAHLLVSHTGVQRACSGPCYKHRNLTDEDVQIVASRGGVIGIGFWQEAVGSGLNAIVSAIEAALEILSEPAFVASMKAQFGHYDPTEHVALGSDFDGAVFTPIDVSEIAALTGALRQRRNSDGARSFDDRAISNIMGRNVCRALARGLPGGSEELARRLCLH
jgi:membrane dipeptidase